MVFRILRWIKPTPYVVRSVTIGSGLFPPERFISAWLAFPPANKCKGLARETAPPAKISRPCIKDPSLSGKLFIYHLLNTGKTEIGFEN